MSDGRTVLETLLVEVEARSHGEVMVGNLLDLFANGKEQLWVVWDGANILAAIGTLIETTGTGEDQARIHFATGEDSEFWWEAVVKEINEWRIAHGCKRLLIFARWGWSRRLRSLGFRARHVEYVLEG